MQTTLPRALACLLTCLLCLGVQPAVSAQFDQPEAAIGFEGELTGKVKWKHKSTWWFVLTVQEAETLADEEVPELAGKEVKVAIGRWLGSGKPTPDEHDYVKARKSGQVITVDVHGEKPGIFRLKGVPEEKKEPGPEAPEPVGADTPKVSVPAGRDASPADISDRYDWTEVSIGGGGYTMGVDFHPSDPAAGVVVRTDVAGAAIRRPGDDRWHHLLRVFSPEDGRMSGSAGFAFSADDPEVMSTAAGGAEPGSSMGIFKSTDGGESWTQVQPLWVAGNKSSSKLYGTPMVGDPENGDVVYYASQQDGISHTRTGGGSPSDWERIEAIPVNENAGKHSRSIAIDPTGGTVGRGEDERSAVVSVAVGKAKLMQSRDGGNTWEDLPGIPGIGNTVCWMSYGVDGDLYASHNKGLALMRSGASAWEDVTPGGDPGIVYAVDAESPRAGDVLALKDHKKHKRGAVWRSRDGGLTWEMPKAKLAKVPGDLHGLYSAPRWAGFDPNNPGHAYYTDAFHVARTGDVWAEPVVWTPLNRGHEETIIFSTVTPPHPEAVRLIAGMADIRGMTWDDLSGFGERIPWQPKIEAANRTSFDFSEADPLRVYAASRGPRPDGKFGTSGDAGRVHVGAVHRSDDGGHNWKPMASPFEGTSHGKREAGGPKIAVSATDPDRVVYLQLSGGFRLSEDGGKTWQPVAIDASNGNGFLHNRIAYDFRHVLAADRVDGETFYAFRRGDKGSFYRSEDGGKSFARVIGASEDLPVPRDRSGSGADYSGTWAYRVAAAPGIEGEVWISLAASGIWRAAGDDSSGGHRTDRFERVAYFAGDGPTHVGFGKPAPGSETPTAFVFGKRESDGQWGVYRWLDLGETWALITPPERPGSWIRWLAGDRQAFGNVFLNDDSYGVTAGLLGNEPG